VDSTGDAGDVTASVVTSFSIAVTIAVIGLMSGHGSL